MGKGGKKNNGKFILNSARCKKNRGRFIFNFCKTQPVACLW